MREDVIKTRCICCAGKGFVFRKKRVAVTESQKKQILKMYQKGMGIREIQRALKIDSPGSVSYAIKMANDTQEYITVRNKSEINSK